MSDLKDRILKLRASGLSYNDIQSQLGCSKSTISYYCGQNQKTKAYQRVQKQRATYPWLTKQARFVERFKEVNVTYNGKYFDRIKVKEYLETVTTCYLSGRPVDTNTPSTYQFDHIVPLSRGGDSSFTNLGVTTPEANQAKSDLTVEEFLALCRDVLENFGYKVTQPK